jgi:sulfite reductase alpha subunit-like flavoprotein
VIFQGEFPANCKDFCKQLTSEDLPTNYLEGLNFSVFGMGDSHYVYYNEAAIDVDKRLVDLGANRVKDIGLGNDQVCITCVWYKT